MISLVSPFNDLLLWIFRHSSAWLNNKLIPSYNDVHKQRSALALSACFMLCNLFSLRRLLPWIKHLPTANSTTLQNNLKLVWRRGEQKFSCYAILSTCPFMITPEDNRDPCLWNSHLDGASSIVHIGYVYYRTFYFFNSHPPWASFMRHWTGSSWFR